MDRATQGMTQLDREKALYRYSQALERGDFEAVSAVLGQAGEDAALERMILEVNQVYQAEMAGERVPVPAAASGRGSLWKRLWGRREQSHSGGETMAHAVPSQSQPQARRAGRRGLWIGLGAGGAVVAAALTLVVAWGLFRTSIPRSGDAALPGELSGWLSSATAGTSQTANEAAPDVDSYAKGYSYTPSGSVLPAERLIIRSGDMSLVVADSRAVQQSVESLIAGMAGEGAFVVSSQEYASGDEASPGIQMTIRVPAARFDEVMDRLAGLAVRVTSRNETAEDVTEEYVDLEARLAAMEAARQRLLEIMGSADTTEDLLAAEQQLTQREAEIESLQGRQQYLARSAQLASIQIDLRPSILGQPVGNRWHPAETVRSAFDTLVGALRGFGDFLIYFCVAVLPWLALIGVVIYLIVRLVLWRRRVHQADLGFGQ